MSVSKVLSFEEWLYAECMIEPSEFKHYDKRHKNELRAEYDEYVRESSPSK